MIFCIEGIDASGKATQSRRMATKMDARLISFPNYESPTGKMIARFLQNEWAEQNTADRAMMLQALMTVNRMEQAPILSECLHVHADDVVLDRYWPSGVVYGEADGLDRDWLIAIHQTLPQAHHYLLLDIDAEDSVQRRPERRDRYEKQPGLMQDVAAKYRALWSLMQSHHKSQWHVIDGRGTADEVEDRIWSRLREHNL